MTFNVVPIGSRSIAETQSHQGHSADVVDLAPRRMPAAAVPEIPEHVLDEVDAAAQTAQDLLAERREVRFDTDADSGRIVASLREIEGAVVRVLPLREIVGGGGDDDGPQSAA
jgi:hypothetical protein